MSNYNLDETPEFFEFVLGGHKYKMRYATTEEVEEARRNLKTNKEKEKWVSQFISSDDKEAPPITKALAKATVKQLHAYNRMLEEEYKIA